MQNESSILTNEQYIELAELFRPNADLGLAINKVKSFLSKDEVKDITNSELRKVLLLNNIDFSFVIKERKEILEKAKENKQFNAANVALDRFETHLGLNNKLTITEKRQINTDMGKISQTIESEKQNREQISPRDEDKTENNE